MADSTVVYTPEQNGSSVPAWMAMSNGGLFGGGNFWGAGIGGFLGSALGNLFNGNGFGLGGGNAAASLGAQATANNNTELLRAAISSNGEQSRQAIQTVSTMLGQDFATVSSQFAAVNAILNNMAVQNATTPLEIVNAIISGNKDMAAQFAQCCCENRLLTTEQGYQAQIRTLEQTNALSGSVNNASQRNVDAIADLKSTMISEFCAARERDMAEKIEMQGNLITQLRGQLDNDRQTAQFTALLAPIQQQINNIAAKQVNTVPVQWPNLTAVNTTPYVSGGFYGNGFGFGFGSGINF